MRSLTRPSASDAPTGLRDVDGSDGNVPATRYLLFWFFSVGGCALDLLTKHWVFQWRGLPQRNHEWWIWEPYFGIETAVNTGALFGIGGGHGRWFALLSIAAGFGILVWLFHAGGARDRWLTAALALVMAGITGNLYDRMGLWAGAHVDQAWRSAVRDWILLRYGGHTWPNFNLADSFLVCGAVMLMWNALREHRSASGGSVPKVPV